MIAEALERIRERHGIPTVADLAAHFLRNPIVPVHLAAALARSLQRYWAGDTEGAALTVLPQIEALARNLLLVENVGIYRRQRGQTPGQYPGLGFLLDAIAQDRNASWHRFLRTFLASPSGINLRNEVLHGLAQVGLVNAALLLQAAGYLAVLTLARLKRLRRQRMKTRGSGRVVHCRGMP